MVVSKPSLAPNFFVVFTSDRKGMSQEVAQGQIKHAFYSNNGYVYIQMNARVRVYRHSGEEVPTDFSLSDLRESGISNFNPIGSTSSDIYFHAKKSLIKIPLRGSEGFDLNVKGATVVPVDADIKFHTLGVDTLGNVYGAAKLSAKKVPDPYERPKYGERFTGVYTIDREGKATLIHGFKTGATFTQRGNAGVSILSDGRIIAKPELKTVVMIDGQTGEVSEFADCGGCNLLSHSTRTDSKGVLWSVQSGVYCDQVLTMELFDASTPERALVAAEKSLRAGDQGVAFKFAEQALAANSKLYDAYYIRGMTRPGYSIYQQRGVDLGQAQNFTAGILGAVYNREIAEQEAHRLRLETLVVNDLILAIANQSNYASRARYRLGEIYESQKDYSKAIRFFYQAYGDKGNRNAENIIAVARVAIRMQDKPLAKKFVDILLRQYPDHPEALFYAGILALANGQHRNALTFFKRAYQKNRLVTYQYHIGVAAAALGDREVACKSLRVAMRQGYPEGHYYLYRNCGYQGESVRCTHCLGKGVNRCFSCDPRTNPSMQTQCDRCNGHGYLMGEPPPYQLTYQLD
jgi:tetratricopeptide (TPR) repeat protein